MTMEEKELLKRLDHKYFSKIVSLNPETFLDNPLYHYTSATALVGIVEQGVLRATHFAFLNDSSEIEYGCELALKIIQPQLDIETPGSSRQQLLKSVREDLKGVTKGREFYVLCFCKKSDILSQFRAYGGKGRICIGLDMDKMPTRLNYECRSVLYDQTKQHQKLREAVTEALDIMPIGDASRDFVTETGQLLVQKLVSILCFLKHPGFAEEQESRIVHEVQKTDTIKFDTSNGQVRPFVDLWVGEPQLPIAEVWVGPAAFQAASERSIRLLLERYGYDNVEINCSTVPYRD
jgi:hypothetical protein